MRIKHVRIIMSSAWLGCLAPWLALAQPIITTQPQNQTNCAGTTATFTVGATGTEPLAYQWQKQVAEFTDLAEQTNATLVLSNVQAGDAGAYRVVVTNIEAAVTSSVANLYVVAAPTLQLSASSYSVAESAGCVAIPVQRTGWLATTVSVDYATADGTATNGIKYTAVSGTLLFGAGETNQTIAVPILNEGLVEGTKYFRLLLSNPTGGAVLGGRTTATVSITDNDVGVQFQFLYYSVAEDDAAMRLGVVRGDDGTLPVTVDFATVNGSAISGVDYVGLTNPLSFAPQERFKIVPVPILNNSLKQSSRTFQARLTNPAGGTLGGWATATVTILDNDQGFQFQSSSNSVPEDAGTALVKVLHGTDDTNSAVTVDCATSDLSARNGVDYLGFTNTFAFAPGERVKQVAVPLLNNGVKQTTRSFRLTLSNPTGGGVLGSPSTTTNSILDNDPGVGFEQTQYTNAWGGLEVGVTVLRGNDWALGPITVNYTTSDGSARAGVEYQAVSGTLQFHQNETVQHLTIPLLVCRAAAGAKYFRITLSNPTGGATLGTSLTTVYIRGAYSTVAPPFDTALTIQQAGGLITLAWGGGGILQRADNAAGPWQTLVNATNPYTLQSPVPTAFYRVTRPRPVKLYVPASYDGRTSVPLVVLLHGYGGSGPGMENWMRFEPLAEARGFLYCYPDGTIDPWGYRFWEATDACCNFLGFYPEYRVDDAGYLRGLLEEIGRRFAVDPKRIYLIGYSNGGFMAYRMACQFADLVAGIASLAGTTFLDPSGCQPSGPVNVLHMHGTADQNAFYAGGAVQGPNAPAFPGALETVRLWAGYNGASAPVTDPAPTMDLATDVAGLETVVTRYTSAPPGGAVELWTINGANHYPTLSTQFSPLVIDWLLAHPKP